MIASNYRKHPDAMALQLPLPFPHRLVWHTARPGVRVLRTIRAARAAAFKAAGRIAYPIKRAAPAWWKQARAAARTLANQVHAACLVLLAEVRVATTSTDTTLIGWNYEQALNQELAKAVASGNRYRQRVLRTARDKHAHTTRHFARGCPRCHHQWVRLIPAPVGLGEWPECTNCGAAWAPDSYDQAKQELNEPDEG